MGLLDGKTAIITGGTSGIGLATAARFLDEGARVFITGRRQSELDAALARLGDRASGVRGDVGVGADLDRLYAAVAESGRGLDIVVANAGVTAVARIGDITEHHLDTLVSTNVKGVVFSRCKKFCQC
jgi:NAD(P)-dependent dehydrogenase (short-subunit alcohol dehydrogenase family)